MRWLGMVSSARRCATTCDLGWIIHRHGVLYAQEYGWDVQREALIASIAGEFVQRFDPRHERCWLAEQEGETLAACSSSNSPRQWPGCASCSSSRRRAG